MSDFLNNKKNGIVNNDSINILNKNSKIKTEKVLIDLSFETEEEKKTQNFNQNKKNIEKKIIEIELDDKSFNTENNEKNLLF
jgi:hypothetical protein